MGAPADDDSAAFGASDGVSMVLRGNARYARAGALTAELAAAGPPAEPTPEWRAPPRSQRPDPASTRGSGRSARYLSQRPASPPGSWLLRPPPRCRLWR